MHIEEIVGALRSVGCSVEMSCPQVDTSRSSAGSGGWVGRIKASLPKFLYELAELAYTWIAYRRLREKIRLFRPDAIYERYNLFLLAGGLGKASKRTATAARGQRTDGPGKKTVRRIGLAPIGRLGRVRRLGEMRTMYCRSQVSWRTTSSPKGCQLRSCNSEWDPGGIVCWFAIE